MATNDKSNELNHQDYLYQAFYFDYKVLAFFYPGKEFSHYRADMNEEELIELAFEMVGGEGITPKIVEKIEELLGRENCIYDFWEFGPDCFSLYWFIHKNVYHEKMKLISQWLKYEELDSLVDWHQD